MLLVCLVLVISLVMVGVWKVNMCLSVLIILLVIGCCLM